MPRGFGPGFPGQLGAGLQAAPPGAQATLNFLLATFSAQMGLNQVIASCIAVKDPMNVCSLNAVL